MKTFASKIKKAAAIALLLGCMFNCSAITPWVLQLTMATNSVSSMQMGAQLLTPPNQMDTPFTVNNTNLVFGGNATTNFTFTFNSSGYTSNALYAGTYKFVITNFNAAFIAVIPDTATVQSLTLYVTNVQVFSGVALNSYGLLTNLLGFPPATNTTSGITNALNYMPATNSVPGVTNALGYMPATNSPAGITNALNYQPATNSPAGITNALNYMPATNSPAGVTNALNYQPATNSPAGITNALNYQPATNSPAGITNALNYLPATNSTAGITAALGYPTGTNGYTGISALGGAASIVTNGFLWIISYKTNNDPGAQLTNAPMGSSMFTTNGQSYVLSNIVWRLK